MIRKIPFYSLCLMTAILLGVAILSSMIQPNPAEAGGIWTMMKNASMDKHELTAAYTLPVAGYDTRVYEWRTVANPNVACTAQFSDSGPVGMQCFDAPLENEKPSNPKKN